MDSIYSIFDIYSFTYLRLPIKKGQSLQCNVSASALWCVYAPAWKHAESMMQVKYWMYIGKPILSRSVLHLLKKKKQAKYFEAPTCTYVLQHN